MLIGGLELSFDRRRHFANYEVLTEEAVLYLLYNLRVSGERTNEWLGILNHLHNYITTTLCLCHWLSNFVTFTTRNLGWHLNTLISQVVKTCWKYSVWTINLPEFVNFMFMVIPGYIIRNLTNSTGQRVILSHNVNSSITLLSIFTSIRIPCYL